MGFNCFVLFWWWKSSTMLKNGYFVESKLSVETHSLFPIYIPIHPSCSHLISSFKLLFLICNHPTLFPWTSTRSEKVTEKIVRIFHCFFLQDTQSNHTSTWFSRDRFPSGYFAIRMVKSHYRNIWLNSLWTLSLSVQNSDRFHGWFIYSMFRTTFPAVQITDPPTHDKHNFDVIFINSCRFYTSVGWEPKLAGRHTSFL